MGKQACIVCFAATFSLAGALSVGKAANRLTVDEPSIDGVFSDPNHNGAKRSVTTYGSAGGWAVGMDKVIITGSDSEDQKEVTWKLEGAFDKEDGKVLVDFSPKGGPKDLEGKVTAQGIEWPDGNIWKKVEPAKKFYRENPAENTLASNAPLTLGGVFSDPNHNGALRSVDPGDAPGTVVITGDDAGDEKEWKLQGTFDAAQGKVLVDFSPKGGPKDLAGQVTAKGITWPDGNTWRKVSS